MRRLLIVLALAGVVLLGMAAQALACSSPCPKGMNCIQVCNPLGELT